MIKIKVVKENEVFKEISVKGHANYEDCGKDIVCAAVSTICITTINGILSICNDSISYIEKDGYLNIKVLKNDLNTNKLLLNMINMLEELEHDYPKNIKIL